MKQSKLAVIFGVLSFSMSVAAFATTVTDGGRLRQRKL